MPGCHPVLPEGPEELDVGRIVDPDHPIQGEPLGLVAVLEAGRIQGGHHVVPSLRALEGSHEGTLVDLTIREMGPVVVAQDDLQTATTDPSMSLRSVA